MRPGIRDGDAVRDLRNDAEIVRNKKQSKAEIAAQLREQFENLLLHGDVERGRWLIGNQEARRFPFVTGKGHGDHRALAQAAGKLMRKLARTHRRLGHGGAFERFHNAAIDFFVRVSPG